MFSPETSDASLEAIGRRRKRKRLPNRFTESNGRQGDIKNQLSQGIIGVRPSGKNGSLNEAVAIQDLLGRRNSDAAEKRFTNANFSAFFKDLTGWHTIESGIYLSLQRTTAKVKLRHDKGDEVLIECAVSSGHEAARVCVENYLFGFSRDVHSVFKVRGHPPGGQTDMETIQGGPGSMILLVFYNLFVRIELLQFKELAASGSPLADLAQRLKSFVKKSSVTNRDKLKVPVVGIKDAPQRVKTGQTFTVEISLNVPCIDQIISEGGNIVHADSEDTLSGRRYTFLATESGESTINFCYAHRETLNFASQAHKIRVSDASPKPPAKMKPPSRTSTNVRTRTG